MKKANFQALHYYNPEILLGCDTYDDFIGKFTDNELVAKSKRTRQIIFGKLNPHRTMRYEKILLAGIEMFIWKNTPVGKYFYLFSMNSDELIYKLKPGFDFDNAVMEINHKQLESMIKTHTNLDVSAKFFHLHLHTFKTTDSDNYVYAYTKDFIDGKREFKCVNEIYFTQIYKLINGMEVENDDLVFYFNKMELARFLNPLIKI